MRLSPTERFVIETMLESCKASQRRGRKKGSAKAGTAASGNGGQGGQNAARKISLSTFAVCNTEEDSEESPMLIFLSPPHSNLRGEKKTRKRKRKAAPKANVGAETKKIQNEKLAVEEEIVQPTVQQTEDI